jgi:hypothetical protein
MSEMILECSLGLFSKFLFELKFPPKPLESVSSPSQKEPETDRKE